MASQKIAQLVVVALMSMTLLLTVVSEAYAQSGSYITIFESDIYLPANATATITVNPSPYSVRYTCTLITHTRAQTDIWTNGSFSTTIPCDGGSREYTGGTGNSVQYIAGSHLFTGDSGIVHIKIEGYNQVDETVNTTPVPPTVTPYGYVAPTATSAALPTNPPLPTMACGLSMTSPCWVAQSTPIGTGSGEFNGETPIAIRNWPTPIPSPTIIPAIQAAIDEVNNPTNPSDVVGTKIGDISIMPDGFADNGDTYTANITAELWDYGCLPEWSTRGINVRLCIKYNYIKSLTLVGIDLPLHIVCEGMIVLAVIYMIKSR